MKKTTKRTLALILVLVTTSILLFGCGKKKTVRFTVNGIGTYELTGIPEGTLNGGINDQEVFVTLDKEGDYDFTLTAEDGTEYVVTIKYHGDAVEAASADELGISVSVE